MKSSFIVLFAASLLYACAPKVKVTAMQPDPVQVPPKLESIGEIKPIADEHAHGKSLYENRCGNCHPLVKTTDFTREQWGPIIQRMQIQAKTTDEETAKIYNYITATL